MNDIFGKSLDSLKEKQLFLLDMDGTIYLDHTLFEGTLPFLNEVKNSGRKVMYITNNSSRSVTDYVQKLKNLGIDSQESDFFTSSMAMSMFLLEKHPGKRVYCMGTKSLKKELRSAGIEVTDDAKDHVEVVVLGYDTELTYQKLMDVCWLLKKELPYLATNPDYVCPVEFGYAPDCGAMSEMLRYATEKMPLFIGKPDPTIILKAMEKSGYSSRKTVVIGDRLYTDIKSGINAGVTTICVLSGETSLADINNSEFMPDYVVPSISTIWEVLAK